MHFERDAERLQTCKREKDVEERRWWCMVAAYLVALNEVLGCPPTTGTVVSGSPVNYHLILARVTKTGFR